MAYCSLGMRTFHRSDKIDLSLDSLKLIRARKVTGLGGTPLTNEALAKIRLVLNRGQASATIKLRLHKHGK